MPEPNEPLSLVGDHANDIMLAHESSDLSLASGKASGISIAIDDPNDGLLLLVEVVDPEGVSLEVVDAITVEVGGPTAVVATVQGVAVEA